MINEGLPPTWPPEVVESADLFRQGHLVAQPPFFYVATPKWGIWDLTSQAGDKAQARDLLDLDEGFLPPYGLITTQTCDIAESRKKPWIQVAPVYPLDEATVGTYTRDLERAGILYWVLLHPPALDVHVWIADLRIEMPIEKSWLVGRSPVEAFDTEEGYLGLAQRLAGRLGRAALHETLVAVQRSLAAWFADAPPEARLAVEVRMYVTPDRLAPESAGLLILTDTVPLLIAGRNQWQDWWAAESERTATEGVALLANQFGELANISALEYVKSIPLELGE